VIIYERRGSRFRITVPVNPPLIYLDHAFLRRLSKNMREQHRFLTAISRRGTLALSMLNMLEIGAHEPGPSVVKLHRFLVEVGNRWCLLNIDPIGVSARAHERGEREEEMAFDRELTEEYISRTGNRSRVVGLDRFVPIARSDSAWARGQLDEMKSSIRAYLVPAQRHHEVTKRAMTPEIPGARAEACFIELANSVLRSGTAIEENDIVDLFHAAVPLSLCDFVLLDGQWTEFSNRVPAPPRRARVFSERKGRFEAFLDALDIETQLPAAPTR
jgi:hypothetical protein